MDSWIKTLDRKTRDFAIYLERFDKPVSYVLIAVWIVWFVWLFSLFIIDLVYAS